MAYQKILILDASGKHINDSNPLVFDANNTASVTIAYQSDAANTTGVGMDFVYSGVTIDSVESVYAGAMASGEESVTSNGEDALSFGWASMFASFPGVVTGDADSESDNVDDALPLATINLSGGTAAARLHLEYTSFFADADPVLNDNPPAPLDPLVIDLNTVVENSGADQVVATVSGGNEGDTYELVVPGPVAPEQADSTQHVYISDSQFSDDGSKLTVTVGYMANVDALSGIGFGLHFDTSALTLDSVSDVLLGATATGTQGGDSGDLDGDSATDSFLSFGWATLDNSFPGATSENLATITFNVSENASGTTNLAITESSSQAGYEFAGQGFEVAFDSPLSIDPATGEVTLNVNPDFETVSEYQIDIVASSGRTGTANLSIVNADEASPVFASATAEVTIAEDAEGVIYEASADDSADASAGVSYSLAGADAAAFAITAGGDLTAVAVDYETKTSYSVTIIADDGVNAVAEQALTVNLTNVDDTGPLFDSGSTASVVENTADVVVYTAAATDDASDITSGPITYSLADDANGLFTIDESSGDVTVTSEQDFESQTNPTFTVKATDGESNSSTQVVTLGVTNADDTGPSITSNAVADVAENTEAGTTVYTAIATDNDADIVIGGGFTYELTAGADLFTIDENTGEVSFISEVPDFEGSTTSYSFAVKATDAANNKGPEQVITLNVTDVPDSKPIWESSVTADGVDENSVPSLPVYTAQAKIDLSSDPDNTAGVTIAKYELVDDGGGLFTINEGSGEVSFTGTPDYEVKNSYSFSVQATDSAGNAGVVRTVEMPIVNLDDKAQIVVGQNGAVNLGKGTGEGQVIFDPADPVAGESVTDDTSDVTSDPIYSLESDYADRFHIDSATGQVKYLPNPELDDPEASQQSILYTVNVTDASGKTSSVELELVLNAAESNAPIFHLPELGFDEVSTVSLVQNENTNSERYENSVQSVVSTGDLSGLVDGVVYVPNASDTTGLTYSVTPAILVDENTFTSNAVYNANAAGSVDVIVVEGEARVVVTGTPWAEGATSYSFTVTATDSSNNSSYQIVTLNDLSGYTGQPIVNSNAPYTLVEIQDSPLETQGLGIDPESGDVYFVDTADYEAKDRYEFKVVGSDGGEQVVSLHVVDTDDVAPVITLENTAPSVDENISDVTEVTSVSVSDDSAVTLSLSGDDASSFSIDADGVVSTKADVIIDHELQSEYNFNVVATDAAGNSSDEAVTLQVIDLDEQGPVFTSADSVVIDEEDGVEQFVYKATAHDKGEVVSSSAISQKFVQNPDGTLTVKFFVDSDVYSTLDYLEVADFDFSYAADHQGILALESIDFPSNPMFKVTNTDTDGQINFAMILRASRLYEVGGDVALAEVTFKVGDPEVAATFSVSNISIGDSIYGAENIEGATVNQYVMDSDSTATFTLKNSDGFSIDDNGNVTITEANHEDFEQQTFTVVASDGVYTTEKTVTVTVNNIDEVAPDIISDATADDQNNDDGHIDENSGSGQVVYTAIADDTADISAGITFSLEGTDADAFVIDAESGEVTLLDNPDYEAKPVYNFTVKASDGLNESTKAVTLDINNLDEVAPEFIPGTATADQDENPDPDAVTSIYLASVSDQSPDEMESNGVTFSLAATNSDSIVIDSSTGEVFVEGVIDHEKLAQYSFTVVATDAAGNSSRKALTVDVKDIDESAPVFISGSTALNIDENHSNIADLVVYTAQADDSNDVGERDDIRYELTYDYNAPDYFFIDSYTGEVRLKETPNFESKSEYKFVIEARDNNDNIQFSNAISVKVNDLDERAPEITSGQAGSIAENSGTNQVVYKAAASDLHESIVSEDSEGTSDGFVFSLAGTHASKFTIDAITGDVKLLDNPDNDLVDEYTFEVIATDSAGNYSSKEVKLNIAAESKVTIAHWGTNVHLDKVTLSEETTGLSKISDGKSSVSIGVNEVAAEFSAVREVETADFRTSVLNSADALKVLKLAIGIVTPDAGVSYKYDAKLDFDQNEEVNDADIMNLAADVNNDGRVNSRDALEILKISVGMSDAISTEWLFAEVEQEESDAFSQDSAHIVGFVRGDVDQSWSGNDNSNADHIITNAPVFTSGDSIEVVNGSPLGTVVYKAAADDDTFKVQYEVDHPGLTVNASGVVTITGDLDGLVSFVITAQDLHDNSTSHTVQVLFVEPADIVAPVFDSPTESSISEADSENTVIYVASTVDSDATFTLADGSDPALSITSNGEVTLSNERDEDIQAQYHFTLVATDSSGNQSKQNTVVKINAVDEVAPTIVSDSYAKSVDENSSGQVIYTVKATDSDYNLREDVQYYLEDTLNGLLGINNDTGEVTLIGVADFESRNEIVFTVIADDGSNHSSKEVVIAVNDLDNLAPEITNIDTDSTVVENSGAGQVVYTATAIDIHNDEKMSDGVVFSLAGTNANDFVIDSKTGEVRLVANPDFEGLSGSYSFDVVASDGKQSSSKTIVVNVSDVDEVAPVIDLSPQNTSVDENSASGHVAYTVTATDDTDAAPELALSSDSDKAVSLENGNIVLNESPDHEMQKEYNFTVIATDAEGNSSSETGSILVVDLDDAAPLIKSDASSSVIEGKGSGDVIYRVEAEDNADSESSANADVSYALLAGLGTKQEVIADTQLVYVGSNTIQKDNEIDVAVNYLADNSALTGLGLKVHYDSSKLSFVGMDDLADNVLFDSMDNVDSNNPSASFVSVAWADVDGDWTGGELPELLFNAKFAVIASEVTTTEISFSSNGTATGYDFAGVSHELKLAPVTIDAQTGDVALTVEADFESTEELNFTVVAKDESGNETLKDVVVSVDNKDEQAPVIDSSSDAGVIVENSGAGQLIYTATSDDSADISQSVASYSLRDADPSLIINSKTGEVYLLANPDYEAGQTISFTVVVEDSFDHSSSKNVTLTVANVDEVGPTFVEKTLLSVDENSEAKLIYTAEANNDIDIEGIDDHSITYSLIDNDAAISIDAISGEVVFNESADYEAEFEYDFTVVATDAAGNSTEKTLTLNVNNLDENAPVFIDPTYSELVPEGYGFRYVLPEAFDGVNGEISSGVTYEIIGEDADQFYFDEFGDIVSENSSFDYEAKSEYTFTVVATDLAGNSSDDSQHEVTVNILDFDEVNPVITSADSAAAIYASNPIGSIYEFTAYDLHSGITLSIEGNSNVEMDNNGNVTLIENANLSSLSSVDFTVRATDHGFFDNTVTKDVSIDLIHSVETISPILPSQLNDGIDHSYSYNSDGTITLKLSIGKNTGIADANITNLDFDLTYDSAVVGQVDSDPASIEADPAAFFAVADQDSTDTLSISLGFIDGYDTAAGLAIFEHTFAAPSQAVTGDLFTVSNVTIGDLVADKVLSDSSSSISELPNNVGTIDDDVVILKDGFANVNLGLGADTLIIDPDYNADIVIDFVSGEDSIDMTHILKDAGYDEGDALQVAGSTPDIADLISNSDESLDNAFGGYFNSDTDVLTLFVDANPTAGLTEIDAVEVTLNALDIKDEDISVDYANFGILA